MLIQEVLEVLEQLEYNGFESYAVGGCVRDSLLGTQPKDWDITTAARPKDIKNIFPDTFDTGIRFGTVSVKWKGIIIEITSFRGEGKYINHRKPSEVFFTQNLREDLKRRDFTINALCKDKAENIIDLFDGQKDLENKMIRAIGNPNSRFSEDALRMLRAVRFACRLGFSIEHNTFSAIQKNAQLLNSISAERIKVELDEILLYENGIPLLHDCGLFQVIFQTSDFPFNEELFRKLPKLPYRYAYLLHTAPTAVINKLKLDRKTTKFLKQVHQHLNTPLTDALSLQKLYLKIGRDALECIVLLKQDEALLRVYHSCEFLDIKDLAISGADLSFVSPKDRNALLATLAERVFAEELSNSSSELIAYAVSREMDYFSENK